MNKKIFRSSILTVFLVLISTITLIIVILFRYFERQIKDELENEADFLAYAIENQGADFLKGFESKNNRITYIDKTGKVMFDSVADADKLDNHAGRKEIEEAIKNGKGISTRYSTTLMEKTVNYAIRLSDYSIVRISTNRYTVVKILLEILQPIAIIAILALALTLILSSRVSRSIIDPINMIDLEFPENNDTYEELTPLLRKIAQQNKTINKQLEDAQKKQKEFNLITENMSEGFLVIDKDANILTHNTAALTLLGITPPVVGNVLTFCREKNFRELVSKVLKGEKTEKIMVQDERNYSLIANPVFEEATAIGAVIIILDVTEMKKRESLRQEFTTNVSHELKTPLTSISGFAELMKEGDVSEDDVVDFSKSIYDEAQRLITLVNDIIKISEFDGKNISFQREDVDLYKLLEEIMNRLKCQADKNGITMKLIGENVKINGVQKILEEMFYNLLDNAIKYNKENGKVDVIINNTENHVNIIVRDTGIGIPAAHRNRIFERFYRVDKSHSKKVGGTGLGLAIVKHGAIYHNAGIDLESEEEKGTVVILRFNKIL